MQCGSEALKPSSSSSAFDVRPEWLLSDHRLSLYKHARIQRIAMVSPVLVQSSFESIH